MFGLLSKSNSHTIQMNELREKSKGKNLIDVREPYEYVSGSIKGAKNIPMNDLLSNPQKYLSKDQTYYIFCQSGGRSKMTVSQLLKAGFQVINVAGGMNASMYY